MVGLQGTDVDRGTGGAATRMVTTVFSGTRVAGQFSWVTGGGDVAVIPESCLGADGIGIVVPKLTESSDDGAVVVGLPVWVGMSSWLVDVEVEVESITDRDTFMGKGRKARG